MDTRCTRVAYLHAAAIERHFDAEERKAERERTRERDKYATTWETIAL